MTRGWDHRCPSSDPRWRSPTQGEYTQATPKVYSWCMTKVRTNIEIEDSYVEAVMDRYGVRTKTEAVDLALRHLAGQPMTREEALAMRGANAIGETPSEVAPSPAT
jgi:Arc/MetJ family transcription regulator